ncbi:MAG TPA: RidA family protein [Planctomycetota bacterium]|nr:RidA family protein [Planctomycetota bacterium]
MEASEIIQPAGWKKPRGYANGILAPAGARALFVAGQIAWDAEQRLVGGPDFVAQFRQALSNVVQVVARAGGQSSDLTRVTIYVVDAQAYTAGAKEVGAAWREIVGPWYPAMTLIVVAGLLERGALVEIEATAMIPPDADRPA